ncbi:hypothetical protein Q3V30_11910 [Erwinia pyri]|uniref:Uncharacterized protein n=1 Tax=Erwinia pyri TaxID=3062598 RepID=A0AA50HKN4_9GAMM|nr:hypothetical protein [Erwinia sp. DE2]WLS77196.1 hypothetical protein Q3V30_11910 [Erwinia sp. DE2]
MGHEAGDAVSGIHNQNIGSTGGEVAFITGGLKDIFGNSECRLVNVNGELCLLDEHNFPRSGDILCYEIFGETGLGKLMGGSLITPDGEAIEGSSLDDVIYLGKVTFVIACVHDESRPII